MVLKFARYMTSSEFARELGKLRAYRNEFVGDRLLERLEESGLIVPYLRIQYPDPIARRFWLEWHPGLTMKNAVEPDGPLWQAAVDLENHLDRWKHQFAHGL